MPYFCLIEVRDKLCLELLFHQGLVLFLLVLVQVERRIQLLIHFTLVLQKSQNGLILKTRLFTLTTLTMTEIVFIVSLRYSGFSLSNL